MGKTTLARQVQRQRGGASHWFDLESPPDRARLEDPYLALRDLRGLVVLDEIQRAPEVFPVLRVLADRRPRWARFMVLGSAAPSLLQQSSESLAGRISYLQLPGFGLNEIGYSGGEGGIERLWLRGAFPEAYLARSNRAARRWQLDFVTTFLERDLPQLGITVGAAAMRRFWTMLAHWHGGIWNGSKLGRSFGLSHVSVRRYLDILSGAFVVRQLQPWHANTAKRQVKSPKVYLRDSGTLHALLGIEQKTDLESHPSLGASWEGFLLEQTIAHLGLEPHDAYFWRTHTGAEIDFYTQLGRRRMGFEFKRTSSPKVTMSMRSALEVLDLHELNVVHAGEDTFPLAPKIRAVSARRLVEDL